MSYALVAYAFVAVLWIAYFLWLKARERRERDS